MNELSMWGGWRKVENCREDGGIVVALTFKTKEGKSINPSFDTLDALTSVENQVILLRMTMILKCSI